MSSVRSVPGGKDENIPEGLPLYQSFGKPGAYGFGTIPPHSSRSGRKNSECEPSSRGRSPDSSVVIASWFRSCFFLFLGRISLHSLG